MLFNNITQFKEFVGGAVNASLEMESLRPTIQDAFDKHIHPWLGDALSDTIIANYEDNALTAEDEALMPYIRRALAKLTMHEYSKVGGIQFSESGMHRIENENHRSAYKYQEENYDLHMLETGYESIEKLLKFLDRNQDNYPDWRNSDAAARHNAYFLRYASEMRQHYSKYITRYAFECLLPIIEEVQCFAIESMMSVGLYGDLQTKYAANNLTPNEKTAVRLIQKALTEFVVFEGIQRHWIQIAGNRIIHQEHKGDQLRSDKTKAGDRAVSLALRHHELMGNRLLSKFMSFIVEHPDDFPLAFCEEGYWADEVEFWTDGSGEHWAYLGAGTSQRCYSNKPPAASTSGCCDEPCPERKSPCGCKGGRGISTSGCGGSCGCGGHSSSSVFRL